MWWARRRGIFRREYEISSDGMADMSLFGGPQESCEFSLSGANFAIERDGRKRFLLYGPDGRLATAERQTGREWAVRAATGNLTLVKPSIWRSGWESTSVAAAREKSGPKARSGPRTTRTSRPTSHSRSPCSRSTWSW